MSPKIISNYLFDDLHEDLKYFQVWSFWVVVSHNNHLFRLNFREKFVLKVNHKYNTLWAKNLSPDDLLIIIKVSSAKFCKETFKNLKWQKVVDISNYPVENACKPHWITLESILNYYRPRGIVELDVCKILSHDYFVNHKCHQNVKKIQK